MPEKLTIEVEFDFEPHANSIVSDTTTAMSGGGGGGGGGGA